MPSSPITTSVFDLFKVGPGPSSSHTIGPMKAAFDFRQRLAQLPSDSQQRADTIQIHLYGSLSATGKGHGTDRAIVAGLLGWQPETTDPDALLKLLRDDSVTYSVSVGAQTIGIGSKDIFFHKKRYDSPYANTMVLKLVSDEEILAEEEYYSIGGGFILRKGEPDAVASPQSVPYPYGTMAELKAQLTSQQIDLDELLLANEMAVTGRSRAEVNQRLDQILDFMHKAVRRGLRHKGTLPGSIRLSRKAPILFNQAKEMSQSSDSFLIFLNAYCLAASEENAAGGIVVTAPTSGASGVIPGLTYLAKHHFHYDKATLRAGMLAAAAIGFLVKHNASISGAEMGCMGEIGTASAMGAAFLTRCAQDKANIGPIEAAAEIAIEHHLGMTCDPIGGYVQIPCIERNAMGAVKAYNAYLLATSGAASFQKISLDAVIKVMKATGRDMSTKYKETSEAGLALSATEC
ncbi:MULTISPECIES: L-serine ammonia-lyase [unclassified Spirosoma]|uniref:L-serine ammonia-lyase n=1 Tax=unclassified Spirosoma TaxID=2621999 RepID=UPI000968F771|nr:MULTISPECIES: L-serine ammonia-lyase [unclassified Spirosoma]MBN8822581.1 L-serine ammonia-lyase [Spirosoma sp.]OJW74076.1 MAG: L-serine ammonia-lyase [Spirosoma sp. 48-14]